MKRSVFIVIIVIVVLVSGCFLYYPQKIAIKERDLEKVKKEYIICKPCLVTGFDWQITECRTGYEGYVFVEGALSDIHSIIKPDVTSSNRFVLYGEFVGERDFYNEGKFPVFRADGWDVLSPVERGTVLPKLLNPTYGLTWLDFYH